MKPDDRERPSWGLLVTSAVALLVFGCVCLLIAFHGKAMAAEADWRLDRSTCHSWEGGFGARGSFSACPPVLVTVTNTVEREKLVYLPATPAPLPVQECPVAPEPAKPAKVFKPRPKVKPVVDCK